MSEAWEGGDEEVEVVDTAAEHRVIIPSVCILVPNRDTVSMNFALALLNVDVPPKFAVYTLSGSTPVAVIRNQLVTKGMRSGMDYLFFLDSDIILDHDTILKLVHARQFIVSAVYHSRAAPHAPVALRDRKPVVGETGLVDIDEVGMGACLIHSSVFYKIGETLPWFCLTDHKKDQGKTVCKFTYDEAIKNQLLCPHCEQMLVAPFFKHTLGFDETEEANSEDFYFCQLVKKAGYTIKLQTDNQTLHESKGYVSKDGLKSNIQGGLAQP